MNHVNGRHRWIMSALAGWVSLVVGITSVAASEERTIGEKIGDTAKKVGTKIEKGVKKVVKKVEDKHVGDKVERKLKKAVDKTAEGFEKAGRKIKQKLGD
jgi:hypothetical protein